ncbi:type I restriction enzyme, M subunit [Halalkaliarchaeum desulfuricum]|uniref:site-specific DNA-methyltransferase (adenine-specific) n=1 Tax=Halalkaliarchaeum desulfuricum TaxID=2055893 RepID=A0A343TLV4_9EURY|nr:class I SAM-dependent DNA methyltransferase [Halalkaliarchaeum desulfuricum]AUX10076.1 type I restriction enzyme, M subunit [Halalkaliarchaeum desulfuricum]
MAENDQATLPGTEPDLLTLPTLEKHLWAAADKLRGSIDSADYKNYIFGLLFLKRANDRFEEETEEVAEELGIPIETARDDRDLHEEFWIPERARWDHIKAQETDVGAALNKALAAIEDENDPIADRVLTTVDFNDKERLPDSLLSDLVSHFSKHRYRNEDLEDPDIFGRAYEYLIREFADDAGKKGGEFYTPREVVRLIVKCVNPQPGHRVYDPCCGSGGMLIYSAEHIREQGGDMTDISLYGQEKNLNTWAIGQMNVLLHELYDAKIEKGDTITDPKRVTKHDELEVFDRVIANPMWNQKEWNKDWVEDNEPYNRFPYGLPPSNRGDWAWIQLMLASLNETGKMGVVMDNGVLFRSRSEGNLRESMIKDDLVEAVIALPEKLFYNTNSPGCILIINKDKPEKLKDSIQFIYAEDEYLRESGVQIYTEGSKQNTLTDEGVSHIAETYLSAREEPHHSRIVSLEEIQQNDWNLSVPRYVDTVDPIEPVDIEESMNNLSQLEKKRQELLTSFQDAVSSMNTNHHE